MKTTYYVASSLDGFIAKADGDVSWLDVFDTSMSDTGYEEFYSTVDALVMGRKTYDFIVNYGRWPYDDKPVWVCSRNAITPMEGCNLEEGSTPEEAYNKASEMGLEHLWCVGGGRLASSFIEADLLTNIYLSLMPILLGNGIKLFGDLPSDVILSKVREASHTSGMVQLEYVLSKNT